MTSGDRAGVREVLHRVPGPAVCGAEVWFQGGAHYQSRRIYVFFSYICLLGWLIFMGNVGKYTTHGSYTGYK